MAHSIKFDSIPTLRNEALIQNFIRSINITINFYTIPLGDEGMAKKQDKKGGGGMAKCETRKMGLEVWQKVRQEKEVEAWQKVRQEKRGMGV